MSVPLSNCPFLAQLLRDSSQTKLLLHQPSDLVSLHLVFRVIPLSLAFKEHNVAFFLVVDKDEFIREGVVVASLAGLRPAFKKEGTVTAANASGLNDGAAALVVMSKDEAEKIKAQLEGAGATVELK